MMKKIMFFLSFIIATLVANSDITVAENKDLTISKTLMTSIETVCPAAKIVEKSDLDADMQKYLRDNNRSYYTIVHDDFNGDTLADWALLVKCQNKKDARSLEKLIVLLKKPNDGYSINVLEEFPRFLDYVYIRPVSPGNLSEWDSKRIVQIKFKGIKRVFFEKSSSVYFWNENKFQYVQTSD